MSLSSRGAEQALTTGTGVIRDPPAVPAREENQEAMKYLCLVYQVEEAVASSAEGAAETRPSNGAAWVEELEQRGRHVLTVSLEPVRTAGAVQIRSGNVSAVECPVSKPQECLGGFSIIDARDLNEAIHLASQLPAARAGVVEVRPVLSLNLDHD